MSHVLIHLFWRGFFKQKGHPFSVLKSVNTRRVGRGLRFTRSARTQYMISIQCLSLHVYIVSVPLLYRLFFCLRHLFYHVEEIFQFFRLQQLFLHVRWRFLKLLWRKNIGVPGTAIPVHVKFHIELRVL